MKACEAEMADTKKKVTTMTDVAKLAGVSQSTVSLVINSKETSTIPQATKDKVMEACQQLGYRPNNLARALHGKHSGVIGFITDELVTTNFAGNMFKGAQDTAWKRHKMLMLVNLDNRHSMLEEAVDMLLSYRVEGFVFATKYHREFLVPDRALEAPIVLANCFDPLHRYASFVPNEADGAYQAASYLVGKGHRNIVFLSNALEIPATDSREKGFRQAMEENRLWREEDPIVRVKIKSEQVYRAATKLLQRSSRPTAILCYNDRSAVSVYSAIVDQGLKVGEDVSVLSFDNQTVISEFIRPGLSTMQLPHYDMGKAAMQYLFDGGTGRDGVNTLLNLSLVERHSVSPIQP